MSKGNVLIIDDEDDIRNLLYRIIKLEGFEVERAATAKEGLHKAGRLRLHCIICDVKLPDGNGVELVAPLKEAAPLAEVVLLTAFGTIPDSVKSIKSGAFDFITKGDDNHRILPIVYRAVEQSQLKYKIKDLESRADQAYTFENMIAKSSLTKTAIEMAKRVAVTDTSVLLTGETGTGKEVFAQSIHQASPRSGQPFVAINCSALGRDLLESELFGHKAGAFTGATKDKKGLLEEANGGTLFLDEIGEMDVLLQAKILRVLENGTFIKVGETKETKVDIRVLAATNRDLKAEAEKENFRLDLYYRLSVFSIQLPPLRDRPKDIDALCKHFVDSLSVKMGKKAPEVNSAFLEALHQRAWKGNIRELKNAIERAVILSMDGVLHSEDLPVDHNIGSGATSSMLLADVEKTHIEKVLKQTGGNKTKSAQLMGIGLTTLYRKIEEYKIKV